MSDPHSIPDPLLADVAAHLDQAAAFERLRDAMLDYDIVVADARRDLEAALARFRAAVEERDTAMRRLLRAVAAPESAS